MLATTQIKSKQHYKLNFDSSVLKMEIVHVNQNQKVINNICLPNLTE